MTTTVPRRPRAGLRSWLAGAHVSPRVVTLAASIAWRHGTGDPVRALLLAWRVLPGPLRGWLRFAGAYGQAATLWGAGERTAALTAISASPRRMAAFGLAVDQPTAAAAALARLDEDDRARPVLAARLAWREGRLTEATEALGRAHTGGARRLRQTLAAERGILDGSHPRLPGKNQPGRNEGPIPGRVLHLVTDALPATSAGYTVRTHEIVLAQRAAGLDPHVVTRCGYPVTQGRIDGRPLVMLDGIPYHRLLPPLLPKRADAAADLGLKMAAGLTSRIRPAVLHAASNFANARIALRLRERYGLRVVYEVRGFWEDTWLSRHPDGDRLASSELYRGNRDLETGCMLAADLW